MLVGRILEIVVLSTLASSNDVMAATSYPGTTCEEFEQGAIFDPYKVVDSLWKIIYFWSDTMELNPIIFSLIAKKRLDRFKAVVDALDPKMDVEWKKATLMMEPRPGVQVVLLDGGTPGAFRGIVKITERNKERPLTEPLIKLADVRMKLVGRYLGMMCCEDLTAFALVRIDEVPTTEAECEAVAEQLGLRGPNGRSYLYVKNLTHTEL